MSEEIWKSVIGYEGLYEVSNRGRVRRCDLVPNSKKSGIMKQRMKKNNGVVVCLCKNGKNRERFVGRIVGQAFGPDLAVVLFPCDETLPGEEWRMVVGFEDRYAVSNLGRVKNLISLGSTYPGKILSPKPKNTGYHEVGLVGPIKTIYRRIHQLVAEAFIGRRPPGKVINHKNGAKTDNRAENLEYVTIRENTLHSIHVLGNRVDGSFNNAAKLTDEQVAEIRRLYQGGGISQQAIADRFGCHQTQVSRIVRMTSWSYPVTY